MTTNRPKRQDIMLCQPLDQKLLENLPEKFYAQPKLRGERAWVFWQCGVPHLISSYGNEFKGLDHINESLFNMPHFAYDGELYIHGWTQEEINSACNRKVNFDPSKSAQMEYHIFDVKEYETTFEKRVDMLRMIEEYRFRSLASIQLVYTREIKKSHLEDYLSHIMEQKYEGIVLRTPWGKYEDKRSKDVIKYKPTETDLYQIIAIKEGEGWASGMLGSFIVIDKEGSIFSVGTGPALTKELRKKWMDEGVIGKWLKVKHEKLKTKNAIPLCTVAMEVIENNLE